jgi:hypothetical protein
MSGQADAEWLTSVGVPSQPFAGRLREQCLGLRRGDSLDDSHEIVWHAVIRWTLAANRSKRND